MKTQTRTWVCALSLLLFGAKGLPAQITVEGVEDRTVYTDQVAFRVVAEPGYLYEARLNGEPVPVGVEVEVTRADFYELVVERRPEGGGAPQTLRVLFIVRASERGNSEWGLPPWFTHPPIPSHPAEFAGASLRFVLPAAWPRGRPLPAAVWVLDALGRRVGVNGSVTVRDGAGSEAGAIALLRGVGSSRLAPQSAAGTVTFRATVADLDASRAVAILDDPSFTSVQGTLPAAADWGENARIRVTGDLVVPEGGELLIGPGSLVALAPGVEIRVGGRLEAAGSLERPIVFFPAVEGRAWGGIVLRTGGAVLELRGVILTGSGADPDWFDNNPGSGSSHRHEQPAVYLGEGTSALIEDSFVIENNGQAGHGEDAELTLRRVLVQRAITTGQFNGGSVQIEDSALVEFPRPDAPFADEDNDALYLTGGAHTVTRTLIGWALDDGIDAGSGSAGSVAVEDCWIESCYHEGLAWSRDRTAAVRNTVTIDCGQGIECGFGGPRVTVNTSLSTANIVGVRYGDNYDWDYSGFITVLDSLLLYNERDAWGYTWDDWVEHVERMDLRRNRMTQLRSAFPENAPWNPEADALLLRPFLPAAEGPVGVGIAVWDGGLRKVSDLAGGVPVRLSSFTTSEVAVDYRIEGTGGFVREGTLLFPAGKTLDHIRLDAADLAALSGARIELTGAEGARITGLRTLEFGEEVTFIPLNGVWRYFDRGMDLGTAWRLPEYDDGDWPQGRAELGFGDGDEATVINGGPSNARYPTIYFRAAFDVPDPSRFERVTMRLRRDDGAVVYLNGTEVFRSNMPPGAIRYSTLAEETQGGGEEEELHSSAVPAVLLVAGRNVIAVEVHQASADSSDLSFALELTGLARPRFGPAFVRGDANGDGRLDVSDAVRLLLVLFRGEPTDCPDALDADDNGAAEVTDAIYVLAFLFRGGPPPPAPFAAPGEDPTPDALDCSR